MGRVLALDLGSRRVGIALSDPGRTFARPAGVLPAGPDLWKTLTKRIADEEVDLVVVGLPLNMDGSRGPKAEEASKFRDEVERRTGLECVTWDERLTTVEAEGYLREGGLSARKRSAKVDEVAAQIILQSYLDAGKAASGPDLSEEPET
jgi:putative holliday junction resolvase